MTTMYINAFIRDNMITPASKNQMSLLHLELPNGKTLTLTFFDALLLLRKYDIPAFVDINKWLSLSESYRVRLEYQKKKKSFEYNILPLLDSSSDKVIYCNYTPYVRGVKGTPNIAYEININNKLLSHDCQAREDAREFLVAMRDGLIFDFDSINYETAPENRIKIVNGEYVYSHDGVNINICDIDSYVKIGLVNFFLVEKEDNEDPNKLNYEQALDHMVQLSRQKEEHINVDYICHTAIKEITEISYKKDYTAYDLTRVLKPCVKHFAVINIKG